MSTATTLTGDIPKVFGDLEEINAIFEIHNSKQKPKLQVFCEILADAGRMRAEELYNAAQKGLKNETPTVNEYRWVDDTTLVLSASGKDILFVEFGTGILNFSNTYPTDTPDAARNAREFYGASYSETHSEWLVPPKVTYFNGWWPVPGTKEWTSGNPPAKAMYEAGKRMREVIEEAARVAFQ